MAQEAAACLRYRIIWFKIIIRGYYRKQLYIRTSLLALPKLINRGTFGFAHSGFSHFVFYSSYVIVVIIYMQICDRNTALKVR